MIIIALIFYGLPGLIPCQARTDMADELIAKE